MIARQTDQLITQQSALIAITGRARPGYQLFSAALQVADYQLSIMTEVHRAQANDNNPVLCLELYGIRPSLIVPMSA